jgi:glyoxylase-like metal-dependent hydrolase (beta-lactamase superfamily II)
LATVLAIALLAALAPSPALAESIAPMRSITPLAPKLFRFQADEHYGVFMVTPAGIVVVDPHDAETARWLRAQLAVRFAGIPVKYVLLSHFHYDHAGGAGVFSDTAVIVGQRQMLANLTPPDANALLANSEAALDANRDGQLQHEEASGELAIKFDLADGDHSGALNAREVFNAYYADVVRPTRTFDRKLTLKIGGESVQLIHVGGRHASDMSLIYFPGERLLYVVDVISVRRLPVDMDIYDAATDTFPVIDRALALKPALVAPGHGEVGTRQQLLEFRQYCRDLVRGVRIGIAAGKSLAEIQVSVLLEPYQGWSRFNDWRERNIAGVYYDLSGRFGIY